jgi:hypothetical protein
LNQRCNKIVTTTTLTHDFDIMLKFNNIIAPTTARRKRGKNVKDA